MKKVYKTRLLIVAFLVVFLISCSTTTKRTPEFNIDQTSHDFGKLVIANTSPAFTVTITNVGNAKLEIESIAITGPNASEFYLNSGSAATIDPQGTHGFEIYFSPTSVGTKNAFVTVTHNAEGISETITVSGEGLAPLVPHCILSQTTFDFGSVVMGTSSPAQTFTISNPGTADLSVYGISLSGPNASEFSLNASAPFDVTASSSKDFTVTFNPANIGTKSATITITHNASTSPDTISLSGDGLTNVTVLYEDDLSTDKGWTNMSDPAGHTGNAAWMFFTGINNTGGSGRYLGANCSYAPGDVFDEYLLSPMIDCSAYSKGTISLEFDGNFEDDPSSTADFARLAVAYNATIQFVDTYIASWNTNGEHRKYDVSVYALGVMDFQVVFYYTGQDNKYFNVDNIKVTHTP